ncbi:MAG: septal ring lytic transglycosylase RlpA family protein [Mycobacterium sp.]|nr:septal ring lytic transglycosylase RlpA family protein [Mycobacterium sp.]
MIDRARSALSGVVVSVLLMGPALALPARAQDTPDPKAPTPAEHRKTAQTRQGRHNVAQAQRQRRPPALHPNAGQSATRIASNRPAALLDNSAATTEGQESGLASWYGGHRWHGKRTSCGSVYDQDALTAAHASLPIGTRVRVTLVGSGRNVVVTINDRPGTRRRIIDLSRAAARELGILERGVAMVTLTPL